MDPNEGEKKEEVPAINISDNLIPENMAEKSDQEMVVDELHKKSRLSSLRSFQGDMAEFIKEKNESVLSIAAKEKKRRDEQKKEEEKLIKEQPEVQKAKPKSNEGFQVNIVILLSSILLIGGGVMASFYVYQLVTTEKPAAPVIKNEIIPFNNTVNLANASRETISTELNKIEFQNGITEIVISDVNGKTIQNPQDFFNLLNVAPPATLVRTLRKDKFALGAISKDGVVSHFLIISNNDFGLAFSSMLEWESKMPQDLPFLVLGDTTEAFWQDKIIKNKDTRVLATKKGDGKIGYTFLDKNTILIISNINATGDITSAFASRSFTR